MAISCWICIVEKIDVKQAQLIKNSAENITICKKTYQSTISHLKTDEMCEMNKTYKEKTTGLTLKVMIFYIVGLILFWKK